ncbi:PAS domain S-box protein [Paenibacillus aurantius]|uniref:histidine kinase n=1 Tax=Paenibacillus aurantius TaxID=2918900 RepID=A0AA96RD71_9BACL|nr:PAS domain S-box protein [Paenibacillus aurantius]WJH34372.1 PAS domain S-box protein [Paenibacillus sp. CC-CFT747]WNQ09492.1 PAS domain S-box protein [Paenibacillus aurantius]
MTRIESNQAEDGQLALEPVNSEWEETIRVQQGMIFKFKKQSGRFVHTICHGELMDRMLPGQEEIAGKDLKDLLPLDKAVDVAAHYERAWQGEEKVTFEGESAGIHFLASLRPIKQSGRVVEVIGSAIDITERKQREQSLKESLRLNYKMIKLLPAAILVHDEAGIINYANDAAVKMMGAGSREELTGRPILELVHPDYRKLMEERFLTVSNGQEPLEFIEHKVSRLDGEVLDVESSCIYIYKNCRPVIQLVMHDITEKKRTEEMVRKSEKLAVVGQLAAGLAHEIRNPLTALKGFTQLLKSRNAVHHEFYEIMLAELDRIHFIINEFMVVAKPQAMRCQPNNVRHVLQSILKLLEPQAILNNIDVQTEFKSLCSLVDCDENQLKQVFVNVIKNAMDSMPSGGKLLVELEELPEGKLSIRFTDQGCGIPEEGISRLGEPFYTTKENGTGLGLMVSIKIVESLHGEFRAASRVNRGTTIEIILPVSRSRIPAGHAVLP